jgi:hypothetical protein
LPILVEEILKYNIHGTTFSFTIFFLLALLISTFLSEISSIKHPHYHIPIGLEIVILGIGFFLISSDIAVLDEKIMAFAMLPCNGKL